jgi:hypothetical protein
MITPRNISYDFKTGKGVVVVEEGQSLDLRKVVALFAAVDLQVQHVKVISGQRTCASFELIAGHWVAFR